MLSSAVIALSGPPLTSRVRSFRLVRKPAPSTTPGIVTRFTSGGPDTHKLVLLVEGLGLTLDQLEKKMAHWQSECEVAVVSFNQHYYDVDAIIAAVRAVGYPPGWFYREVQLVVPEGTSEVITNAVFWTLNPQPAPKYGAIVMGKLATIDASALQPVLANA